MKAIKILFLFCIAALSISNVQAQKPCEIDSYTNNFETGFKIIQSSIDKSIFTISISGLNGRLGNDKPNFNLTKYNSCGDLQWKSNLWSSSIPGFGVGGIWEETNGDIISSIFYKNNLGGTTVRLLRANKSGSLLSNIVIGDSTKLFNIFNTLKTNNNKVLLLGNFEYINSTGTNRKYNHFILADTNGNIYKDDSINLSNTANNSILFAYKINQDSILLLGYDDKELFITNIDINGNILDFFKIKQLYFPLYFASNTKNNELLFIGNSSNNDSTYVVRYDQSGSILKDSIFTNNKLVNLNSDIYYFDNLQSHITPLTNGNVLFSANNNVIMDSNLKIIWFDTTSMQSKRIFNSILTKDSTIASVGTGNFHTSGIGNIVSQNWFGITSFFHYVKSITISGNSFIDDLHGTCQLSALISPIDADYPNIIWSVNDSNMATITQNGLVTAKTNGIVTAIASSQDGSGIMSTKNIRINNQDSKTTEVNAASRIQIYPNPANDFICLSHNTKFNEIHYTLFDIYGIEMLKGVYSKSSSKIDLNGLQSGIYFLKIDEFAPINYKIIKN